jgi:hypothetical protein
MHLLNQLLTSTFLISRSWTRNCQSLRAWLYLKRTLLRAKAPFRSISSPGWEQTKGSSSLKGAKITRKYFKRIVAACSGRTAKSTNTAPAGRWLGHTGACPLLGSSSWTSASMWQLGWDGGCRSHWWTMGWLPSWLWMGSLMYFS